MTTTECSDDPFAEHQRRDPLPSAGIRVIMLTRLPGEDATGLMDPLAELIASRDRPVERRIVAVSREHGMGQALRQGLLGAHLPLVLVTTACEPWTDAHLDPLLQAIDGCDHVIGCRPRSRRAVWTGLFGALTRSLVFALPLRDVYSPCRLHRLDKLAVMPFQSASSFLDVEILAKATFLGHLIDEVQVPPLGGHTVSAGSWTDWNRILRHPKFAQSSGPTEETQSQQERADGPGAEDQEGCADIEKGRSLEQHPAQRSDQLRQGQGLDKRLGGGGETVRREENAREQPHWQHDHVHQPADRLGAVHAASDQKTDSSECQRAQELDADYQGQVASDRHVEHEFSQEEQHSQVRNHKRKASAEEGEQEITSGHGGGDEPLQELGDPEIDQQEANAPEPSSHRIQPD
jgi:hypothetical protein